MPALLLAFVIGIVGFGCYCTMWYHKRITHDSQVDNCCAESYLSRDMLFDVCVHMLACVVERVFMR